MNVCITGASGRIGSSLLTFLAGNGAIRLRALKREASLTTATSHIQEGVEWYTGDLNNPTDCMRLIENQDVVVHLANDSVPLTSDKNIAADALGNLVPTLNLLQAICSSGRNIHLVFASSGGAIYDPNTTLPFSEASPCLPSSAYGVNKLASEHYITLMGSRGLLTATILRISTAYGWIIPPTSQQGFIGVALHQALNQKPIRIVGSPHNIRDYIFVDDICAAISLSLYRRNRVEIFNIGSGTGTSVLEIINLIREIMRKPIEYKQERWDAARFLPTNCVLDTGLAHGALGWTAKTTLTEGIQLILSERRTH